MPKPKAEPERRERMVYFDESTDDALTVRLQEVERRTGKRPSRSGMVREAVRLYLAIKTP